MKYSTPMEGPDNQFGSAERSDDEDEKEIITESSDEFKNLPKPIDNTTNNKTIFYSLSNAINVNHKISNKVSKIFDNLEIDAGLVKHNQSNNLNASKLVLFILVAFSHV